MSSEYDKAVIDGENGLVIFPISDSITLRLTFEEWENFVNNVYEVNLLFEATTRSESFVCGSCGTFNTKVEYYEPDDEDIN